jgi:DNA-directed RNA polymerase II subunit RPB1
MDILYDMGLDDDVFNSRATTPFVKGARFITTALNYLDIFIGRYEPSSEFLLVDNVIQYGVLNKAIVGTADDSIIHHIFLMAGHLKAAKFIHLIQIAATKFLDGHGFSVGISDCVIDHTSIKFDVLDAKLKSDFFKNGGKWSETDECAISDALSELTKLKAPEHIKNNRLLDMINSGSKGSIANFNQITRVVGQQIAEDGRMSKHFGGERTLPHHTKYDTSVGSRGLVKNSFVSGLTPQEFFFHAIGGRVGIIDTSIKTSETGYIHRKLVKTTEPLIIKDCGDGDRVVVNQTTKQLIQMRYGDDSLDGTFVKRLKLDNNRYI